MFCADGLYRIRYEFAYEAKEAFHVWELSMRVECRLIDPLRMNKENGRIARGFVEMDTNAAMLDARGLEDKVQLVVELLLLSRFGLKANEDVKGHARTREEFCFRQLQSRRL